MKYLLFLSFIAIMSYQTNLAAQTKKFGVDVSGALGIIPVLNNGSGMIWGLHGHYNQWKSISIESVVNYSNINITDVQFLGSDRKYNSKNLNFLIGIRRYLNSPENKHKFFLSILGGVSREIQKEKNLEKQTLVNSALSLGIYYESKPIFIGVGLESPNYLFLKLGIAVF